MTQINALLETQSLTILAALAATLVVVALARRYLIRQPLDLMAMWGDTRMVVYAAVTGALYFAVLIPFKWAVVVPGFTEIRPGVALPLVLAFVFGPAAAWGAGVGNFIGDFFGMMGPGSLFGFFGNFLLAYCPYAIYRAWVGHVVPSRAGAKGPIVVAVGIVTGAFACATFIAWGAHMTGLAPFRVLAPIIAVNNTIVGLVLALPLTLLMVGRAEKWGVTYYEVMEPAHAKPAPTAKIGALLLLIGALGGFALGMVLEITTPTAQPETAIAALASVTPPATQPTDAAAPTSPPTPAAAPQVSPARVGVGVAPAILLILIGILLL